MKAQALAALHYLSKDYGGHPHEYIGSETWPPGVATLYFKWAVDDAARQCALQIEHERYTKEQEQKRGFWRVERE